VCVARNDFPSFSLHCFTVNYVLVFLLLMLAVFFVCCVCVWGGGGARPSNL
jgi:hypothetical protein